VPEADGGFNQIEIASDDQHATPGEYSTHSWHELSPIAGSRGTGRSTFKSSSLTATSPNRGATRRSRLGSWTDTEAQRQVPYTPTVTASPPEPTDEQLADYRSSIDNIDAALVHLLAERFKITQAVGRHKAAVGLAPSDPVRERAQITRLRALAVESGLDPAFTETFLRFIVDEVIRHHRLIADSTTP